MLADRVVFQSTNNHLCGLEVFYVHGVVSHDHALVATLVFLHSRVAKVPRSVAVRQPVALLDEDLQAACDFVVAEGEDDVSAHLHAVKVARFTVNAHEAAQHALWKCENTPVRQQ